LSDRHFGGRKPEGLQVFIRFGLEHLFFAMEGFRAKKANAMEGKRETERKTKRDTVLLALSNFFLN